MPPRRRRARWPEADAPVRVRETARRVARDSWPRTHLLVLAVNVGVEQAGGQWARARGGLAGATMSPVAQGNIGAAKRQTED
jgi:hypothetical protein